MTEKEIIKAGATVANISKDNPCWIIGVVVEVDGYEVVRPVVTLHHHDRAGAMRFCGAFGEMIGQDRIGIIGPETKCLHPDGVDRPWHVVQRIGPIDGTRH